MDAPQIWVPKLKIHEAQVIAPPGFVKGEFTLETVNRYGRVTRRLGPWKQVVTDLQMDSMFMMTTTGQGRQWCRAGTGSPVFTTGSVGLANAVGSTSTDSSSSTTADIVGTDGYRSVHTITKEFALGAIVANLTEIGMFSANDNVSGRFLDLIRDSGGTPTSFPVTADDQLRVTHTCYRYPALSTFSGSFTIGGGAGSGVHNYEMNMSSLNSATSSGSGDFGTMGCGNNNFQAWECYTFRDCTAIGSVTDSVPTGGVVIDPSSSSSGGNGASSNDGTTWKRTKTFTWGLTTANHANGINGFKFGSGTARCYKMKLDTPIPKFAGSIQRILSIEFSVGVTRP